MSSLQREQLFSVFQTKNISELYKPTPHSYLIENEDLLIHYMVQWKNVWQKKSVLILLCNMQDTSYSRSILVKKCRASQTEPRDFHTNAWIYGLRFRKTSAKRSFSVIENECFGLVFAKNWVYKFGHKWIFAAESWILKSCCTFFFFFFSLMRES
jgi:hypothetical protein